MESITHLLAILSRPGTLHILELAEKGLESHKDTCYKIGLSSKQYYSRLSQLTHAGLVKKVSNAYIQTKFGNMVWKEYIPQLRDAFMSGRYSDEQPV